MSLVQLLSLSLVSTEGASSKTAPHEPGFDDAFLEAERQTSGHPSQLGGRDSLSRRRPDPHATGKDAPQRREFTMDGLWNPVDPHRVDGVGNELISDRSTLAEPHGNAGSEGQAGYGLRTEMSAMGPGPEGARRDVQGPTPISRPMRAAQVYPQGKDDPRRAVQVAPTRGPAPPAQGQGERFATRSPGPSLDAAGRGDRFADPSRAAAPSRAPAPPAQGQGERFATRSPGQSLDAAGGGDRFAGPSRAAAPSRAPAPPAQGQGERFASPSPGQSFDAAGRGERFAGPSRGAAPSRGDLGRAETFSKAPPVSAPGVGQSYRERGDSMRASTDVGASQAQSNRPSSSGFREPVSPPRIPGFGPQRNAPSARVGGSEMSPARGDQAAFARPVGSLPAEDVTFRPVSAGASGSYPRELSNPVSAQSMAGRQDTASPSDAPGALAPRAGTSASAGKTSTAHSAASHAMFYATPEVLMSGRGQGIPDAMAELSLGGVPRSFSRQDPADHASRPGRNRRDVRKAAQTLFRRPSGIRQATAPAAQRMTEAQVRVETHGEPHAHLPETLFEGSSESARPSGEVSLGGGPGTAPVEVAARPFTAAPGAATQVNDAAPVAPTRAEGFDGSGIETQPLEPSRLHRAHEDTIAGRVSERGVVVNVDADLTVRVAMSDEGVEVMVEGSTEAIEPLRDLESDLRDALKQDGQDLMEFSARERSERDEAEEDGSQGGFVKTETKKNNRAPVGRGQLLNAVA